jgi:hypothetical protein
LTTGATVFVTGVVLLTEFVTGVAAGACACEAVPVDGVVLDWLGVAPDPVPGLLVLVPEELLEPWVPAAEGEAPAWEPEVAFEAVEVTVDVTLFRVDLTPERPTD